MLIRLITRTRRRRSCIHRIRLTSRSRSRSSSRSNIVNTIIPLFGNYVRDTDDDNDTDADDNDENDGNNININDNNNDRTMKNNGIIRLLQKHQHQQSQHQQRWYCHQSSPSTYYSTSSASYTYSNSYSKSSLSTSNKTDNNCGSSESENARDSDNDNDNDRDSITNSNAHNRNTYNSRTTMTNDSSHAMRDSYQEHSGNQYSAHIGCQDLLLDCVQRLKDRRRIEQQQQEEDDNNTVGRSGDNNTLHVVDLGSADGSNSKRTMDILLNELSITTTTNSNTTILDSNSSTDIHIVFEEHPSSDETKLKETIAAWHTTHKKKGNHDPATSSTQTNNITYDVLMKSFYEPLFPPETIDFCMSYICLHWLDADSAPPPSISTGGGGGGVSQWKRMHLLPNTATTSNNSNNNNSNNDSNNKNNYSNGNTTNKKSALEDFVQINERSAPPELTKLWKTNLADPHFAKFLSLRAKELKRGGELLVMMVSSPHEFLHPQYNTTTTTTTNRAVSSASASSSHHTKEESLSSPLTIAMKRCIENGTLRKEVLENTIVPYYLRQPQDVYDALTIAQTTMDGPNEGSNLLEVVEIRHYETMTCDTNNSTSNGDSDCESSDDDESTTSPFDGPRQLFWAIHGGAVVNSGGATPKEVDAIQQTLTDVFEECFGDDTDYSGGDSRNSNGHSYPTITTTKTKPSAPQAGIIRGHFLACVFRKKTRTEK